MRRGSLSDTSPMLVVGVDYVAGRYVPTLKAVETERPPLVRLASAKPGAPSRVKRKRLDSVTSARNRSGSVATVITGTDSDDDGDVQIVSGKVSTMVEQGLHKKISLHQISSHTTHFFKSLFFYFIIIIIFFFPVPPPSSASCAAPRTAKGAVSPDAATLGNDHRWRGDLFDAQARGRFRCVSANNVI
jgi:hypothetical protein